MPQEKRQFRRIPLGATVSFQELSFQKEGEAARTVYKDVSVGGLLVSSDKPLPLGSLLKLELKVPGWGKHQNRFGPPGEGDLRPLVAVGEVVRLERMEEDGSYELGVKFLNVYPDDLAALVKFIEAAKTETEA